MILSILVSVIGSWTAFWKASGLDRFACASTAIMTSFLVLVARRFACDRTVWASGNLLAWGSRPQPAFNRRRNWTWNRVPPRQIAPDLAPDNIRLSHHRRLVAFRVAGRSFSFSLILSRERGERRLRRPAGSALRSFRHSRAELMRWRASGRSRQQCASNPAHHCPTFHQCENF